MNNILYKDLSYQIIGLAMEVHRKLGYGFLEKVYFEGEAVGNYVADILIEDKIIIELKCVEKINNIHKAQALNYLKATRMRLAIILNFAKDKLQYERLVL